MDGFFKDTPGLSSVVKFAIVAFIGLSLVNLYYSIRLNRKLLDKAE